MAKTPAWTRKEGKDPKGGLNKAGVASYRRANPSSKLQTAVTTPPSKLKAGSKPAKRRASFCSRMKGMKAKLTSAKTAKDPNSRINKSLRKWNC
jgi:transposase